MSESSYIEAELIVEGALDEYRIFDNDGELQAWINDLKQEHGHIHATEKWEVFTIKHSHPYHGDECDCAAYLQDHRPHTVIGDTA